MKIAIKGVGGQRPSIFIFYSTLSIPFIPESQGKSGSLMCSVEHNGPKTHALITPAIKINTLTTARVSGIKEPCPECVWQVMGDRKIRVTGKCREP
jgi:hypothetical protein